MTIEQYDRRIGDLEGIRAEFAALHQRVSHRLETFASPPGRPDRHRDDAIYTVRETKRQIEDGVDRTEPMEQELWALVSKYERLRRPGLATIDRELRRLRDERAEEVGRAEHRAQRWPSPETTHAYRLVRGRHMVADRYVRVGDVVQLNEQQAQSFADLFEPVDDVTV